MDDQVIDRRENHEVIQQSKWERSSGWPKQNLTPKPHCYCPSTFSKHLFPLVLECTPSLPDRAPAFQNLQHFALHLGGGVWLLRLDGWNSFLTCSWEDLWYVWLLPWLDGIHSCSSFSLQSYPSLHSVKLGPGTDICEVWAQQSLRSPGVLGAECTCPSLSFLSIIYCSQL